MAEVYIEGKRLDVFEGFKFSFNYSIADIRHPEKRSTEYSKTIRCPGTPNNDSIFGQIYDLNISNAFDSTAANIDVNFNPNKKAEAIVIADGLPIMKGSIQLRKIKRKYTDYIYEVVFVGKLVDIFGVLGDKQLNGVEAIDVDAGGAIGSAAPNPLIDFSDLDHDYTRANQETSWTAGYGSGYVYPMVDYGQNLNYNQAGQRIYKVESFNPALYLKEVIDRIFSFAGFTYTSNILSSAFFERLIIPLTDAFSQTAPADSPRHFDAKIGNDGNPNPSQELNQLWPDGAFGGVYPALVNTQLGNNSWLASPTQNLQGTQQHKPYAIIAFSDDYSYQTQGEPNGGFDYGTGGFGFGNYNLPSPLQGQSEATFFQYTWEVLSGREGIYRIESSINLRVIEEYNRGNLTSLGNDSEKFSGSLRLMRWRGAGVYTITEVMAEESFSFNIGNSNPNFVGQNISIQDKNISFDAEVDAHFGDKFWMEIYSNELDGPGYRREFWAMHPTVSTSGISGDWYYCRPQITEGFFKNTYLSAPALQGESISINNSLPEVGMADLLKSVINMFNLYVVPDPNQENNLLIETRDDFYSGGEVKDWSKKLDYSKEVDLQPLALLTANEFLYTYAEDSDYYNERYQDSHGHTYGRARVDIDNDFLQNSNKTEVIFSPTPLVNDGLSNRLVGKIYDADIDEGAQPTDHNIRIMYYGGLLTSSPQWHHEQFTTGAPDIISYSSYPYAGHLTHPLAPSQDINFGVPSELFYSQNGYTGTLLYTNDNLFNRYHRRGLLETTNKDSKMMTAYFTLSPIDIHRLDFRDQILIDNSYWRINKVMNYNPFDNDLTKVELFKVITKEPLKMETFNAGGGGVISQGTGTVKRPTTVKSLKNGNDTPIKGGFVRGKNNEVDEGVTSFMVQGNRNKIKKGSRDITIIGDDNIVEEGVTRVRLINTSGVTVTESNQTFINNRQQESSEVLEGGEDEVRALDGGTNIFTVDGGEDIVQAQFSESSIYIVEGN